MNEIPVLWQFTASHYNEKARWALDYKGVPHVRRSLLPGAHAVRIRRMTGQTAVPVLEMNGAPIHGRHRGRSAAASGPDRDTGRN